MRGYFGIGIENAKTEFNVGTLWRTAQSLGASYIFTVGRRYSRQASDTTDASKHIPLYHFASFDAFYAHIPYNCMLVGIEITPLARPIDYFTHPERAVYLLGAEDHGLSKRAMSKCHAIVTIPGKYCLNVAVAGSIVMYDRLSKETTKWYRNY